MPRVSATLIVRNESKFIGDCLRSLLGNVDEIVVIDTGSQDDTVAIARQFGVNLCEFEWCNDFSAARNHALNQATGDWILYIDADERLEIPDPSSYSRLLADSTRVAWNLRLHPRVGWTAYAELRLFRNDPRIRFEGVIHERIHPGVETVAREDRLSIGSCDIELYHLGYEADQRPKNARNIPLLREYLARHPSRLYCWWHLGECLRLAGDSDGAYEAWSQGIARSRVSEWPLRNSADSLLYLSLLKLMNERGDAIDGVVTEALSCFPENLALQWIAAQLAVEGSDPESARPVLEKLTAIDADAFFDPQLAYDKALFRHLSTETLARCNFRSGHFAEAARLYHVAADTAPNPDACRLKARLAQLRARAST